MLRIARVVYSRNPHHITHRRNYQQKISIAEQYPQNLKEIKNIREQTQRGRVLDGIDFVKKIEKRLGRELVLKTKG